MTVYVALLHSIVLGPDRRLVMADLRAMAEGLGFRNTRTLVATGNLIFEGDDAPLSAIEEQLETAFHARFGKHVDIILRSAEDWRRVAAGNPFADGNGADVGIRVMRKPLGLEILPKLEGIAAPGIRLAIVDGDLWIDFSQKPSETRLLSHLTTKKLGIGTLRNANTVNGLAAMLA
ncbi:MULTISPECIES: DUF1697 domain-containing protein [unclassified Shinella]|jgi:uncharacterized protein (DUF1697 family)|uniref:DUF1697 domain-containing protein n=1 Tax=unclassified Shinella TaxID=2643062 RepID=UPI0003C54D7E|nr:MULTISPECIES: DUF1697 domain-containing protein [unclassified Shinella]MCA0338535.1 DUF1697 domain-containing protein [Pseudomonadota bacterium]EYR80971.1 hypothetical protein SHLA_104c000180 [Shinella sp. DD12]MCO5152688.1 DUF1697 domain-containing protein [Shinella sp.]MDC7261984.1 DUF1697 domain-containing protein [Shinella sp. HY16]MDC7268879.1 DUF1697 domain-containing protein [Shinella sp. YZ44]